MKEEVPGDNIPTYQVDAFTDAPFRGNPAAVCLLSREYEDTVMQNIAAEMNLSETAFVLSLDKKPFKGSRNFSLRWFTPKVEVPLCGHATLAAAAVLFSEIEIAAHEISFETKSGILKAKRDDNGILLDFPANAPEPVDPPTELLAAMGITEFKEVLLAKKAKKLLVHLADAGFVKNLKPNYAKMKNMKTEEDIMGVIATSLGSPPYDFISRFFAPWVGINEDPVTGAAHTVLAPYWSERLVKEEMIAFQASERGGNLIVRYDPPDRVNLIGNAVIVLKGELHL
ncbi:MAG: PhzF family phenazine biosynthesis protein [Thermoplasmata archaeon]|nr:MAG: PhzF family phenazine biosynthesis protein [Thermoplasmata archaeon]